MKHETNSDLEKILCLLSLLIKNFCRLWQKLRNIVRLNNIFNHDIEIQKNYFYPKLISFCGIVFSIKLLCPEESSRNGQNPFAASNPSGPGAATFSRSNLHEMQIWRKDLLHNTNTNDLHVGTLNRNKLLGRSDIYCIIWSKLLAQFGAKTEEKN